MWLIFEGLIAFAVLALVVASIWIGDSFTLPEMVISFVLCNIWLATIDMRKES